jgi:hypothetical protein
MNKQGLPLAPTYRRLLLARGELGKTPRVYSIKWFSFFDRATDLEWTWGDHGLSIVTDGLGREDLRMRWELLAERCLQDRYHFASLQKLHPLEWKHEATA